MGRRALVKIDSGHPWARPATAQTAAVLAAAAPVEDEGADCAGFSASVSLPSGTGPPPGGSRTASITPGTVWADRCNTSARPRITSCTAA
jgi:hypothetical protein